MVIMNCPCLSEKRSQVCHIIGIAVKRANGIKRKMLKDKAFHNEYTKFVMKLIDAGYARKARITSEDEQCWYLPHHAVYHPAKLKIRVVFDCSAEFEGVSLNSQLLQGPDLTNHLIGVFLRFRKEVIAIIGNLEAMYCQVLVPEHQRRYIRFLFWPDGNLDLELEDYEMCVHVFGPFLQWVVSTMLCIKQRKTIKKHSVQKLQRHLEMNSM